MIKLLPRGRTMTSVATNPALSTIDKGVVTQFQKLAEEWWDESGSMKGLHSMNKLRVPFVRDRLINTGVIPEKFIDSPDPLKDVTILDVGCGGGILSEPLARLGGIVTGLDATCELIEVAKTHARDKQTLKNLNYTCSSIEKHALNNEGKYDAVVASEILEHVTNKSEFLEACVRCLKPNGSIFVTTLNKTLPSYFCGILIAENVLRLLPKGTHEWEKFLAPPQLQRFLEDNNCRSRVVHGMGYNFISNTWFWTKNVSINYALHAVKL